MLVAPVLTMPLPAKAAKPQAFPIFTTSGPLAASALPLKARVQAERARTCHDQVMGSSKRLFCRELMAELKRSFK
jgi:hypothetical protein